MFDGKWVGGWVSRSGRSAARARERTRRNDKGGEQERVQAPRYGLATDSKQNLKWIARNTSRPDILRPRRYPKHLNLPSKNLTNTKGTTQGRSTFVPGISKMRHATISYSTSHHEIVQYTTAYANLMPGSPHPHHHWPNNRERTSAFRPIHGLLIICSAQTVLFNKRVITNSYFLI